MGIFKRLLLEQGFPTGGLWTPWGYVEQYSGYAETNIS